MRAQIETTPLCEGQLAALTDLAASVGANPLLTHGSAGNCSYKLDGTLWIKASGKWMGEARQSQFVIPLDLWQVQELVAQGVDPAERFPGASIETSMHAVLPHTVVLHVHSVNTISWAVRSDARAHLDRLLRGLDWCWIPYVSSGLYLARAIKQALAASPNASVFVLGNHGLVIGGADCAGVHSLLYEVENRLANHARSPHPADYSVLEHVATALDYALPDDDAVHAFATDPNSRDILSRGILIPAQTILANFHAEETYRPTTVESLEPKRRRTLTVVENIGVLFDPRITPAEQAMLSCLAQVVQRIPPSASIRYLPQSELNQGLLETAYRYRDLANSKRCPGESALSAKTQG